MSFASSVHTIWCFVAIAVYAGAYAVTKDTIANLLKAHKAAVDPLADAAMYGGLAGVLLVGIIADKVSARAAVNVTLFASAAIYAVAFMLLEGRVDKSLAPQLAIGLKMLTVLQHTMQAMTTYACIRMGGVQMAVQLGVLLQVGLGYTAGNQLATRFVPKLGLNPMEILIAAMGAHIVCIVLSWLNTSPVATLVVSTGDGQPARRIEAPGRRKSFIRVFIAMLPALLFIAAIRLSRVFTTGARDLLKPGSSPVWSSWPMPLDQVMGVASNLFVIPGLMLFARGPGSILAIAIACVAAARAAMLFDPALVEDKSQSQLFTIIFAIGGVMFYNLPTYIIGTTAEPGTKGRAVAIQAVVTNVILYKADIVKPFVLAQARLVAPSLTALSLSQNEIEGFVLLACLAIAFVALPGVSLAAPHYGRVSAAKESAKDAQAAVAQQAAQKPKLRGGKK